MKKKQLKEIKNKTVEELEKLVMETETQLSKLKLEALNGKNKNKRLGKSLRKEIAQVKTIISARKNDDRKFINEKGK